MDAQLALARRLEDRTAHIGILGLGYVGIPLARAFCEAGFAVNGFDVDEARCESLNRGISPLRHLPDEVIGRLVDDGVFFATTDFKVLRRMDVAIICVPTPLSNAREPDLSFVEEAAGKIRRYMNPGMLVVLESTTYPGTTEEIVRPILDESGLYCGEDFFLAFSPEREDPGNANYETRTIPKLVGGVDEASGRLACQLYSSVIQEVVQVSDSKVAEAAKVLENIYRCVNIALVNELKILFDRMDIDVWEVIEAASTKPFGFQAFYPGPGLGGHCIPIDPFYLAYRARQYDLPTRFIELAGEINTAMPEFVLSKISDTLNDCEKSLRGSEVFLVGVAYKKDVEDVRESPALRLIPLLRAKGAIVRYHDPFVPTLLLHSDHGEGSKVESDEPGPEILESVDLSPENLRASDLCVIVTDHSDLDYDLVVEHAPAIVDTRNALSQHSAEKVVKA